MTEKNDKITFEEALKALEEASGKLKSTDVPLDEAIKNYEVGIEYYKLCSQILNEAEQKLESITK
ncbi:MAG: exodeoxyribonuclease VII small subunit [Firmicutes bacterium]|nr:exodeoxyribonuclease VII small subunit [Bacillota bacterium]